MEFLILLWILVKPKEIWIQSCTDCWVVNTLTVSIRLKFSWCLLSYHLFYLIFIFIFRQIHLEEEAWSIFCDRNTNTKLWKTDTTAIIIWFKFKTEREETENKPCLNNRKNCLSGLIVVEFFFNVLSHLNLRLPMWILLKIIGLDYLKNIINNYF